MGLENKVRKECLEEIIDTSNVGSEEGKAKRAIDVTNWEERETTMEETFGGGVVEVPVEGVALFAEENTTISQSGNG